MNSVYEWNVTFENSDLNTAHDLHTDYKFYKLKRVGFRVRKRSYNKDILYILKVSKEVIAEWRRLRVKSFCAQLE